ncbi:hypothetical protein MSIBF_A3630006 [groundwater metagenome]|uniref:LamG-like jellyroll fold domain-containing protein n=1 Tax=groundwater metagenome TaxID=717931 RepID=A0A098ECQ5_9ZZZZ
MNDYVVTDYTQNSVTTYTIEVWVKTMDSGNYKTFVQDRGSVYGGGKSLTLGMGRSGGGFGSSGQVFYIFESDYIDIGAHSVQTINDNNWHHVAGVWSAPAGTQIASSQFKIYIDGVQATVSANSVGYIISPATGLGGTKIARHDAWNTNFAGTIDEVRIYNRALTAEEIKADMLSTSPEMMKKVIQDTISKTQTKINQLKKENINTEAIEKIITSAEDALQKEAYKTALEQAQDASSKADKVWNAFQSYNTVKKEVDAKVDQLKREDIDTAIIEKSLSEAKSAFENENFELAQRLVSDAESKADKSWSTYQYIETAKNAVKEAKGINCDASNAEKRVNDAVDALNKGSYDIARQYASNAVSLANKANCGKINIKDLKALSVKYDRRTVEISGKVRDIETVYGKGYKFTVDDGTGLIVVGYEGSIKDVNNGDTVNVKGVFSRSNDAVIAEKVEKSGIIDILPGGDDNSGGGNLLFLLIGGVIIIVVVVAALFILKKNKGGEKGMRDVGERI